MPAFCRRCHNVQEPATRCLNCGSPRVLSHPELFTLGIAHMDCDSFFASVEKRDNPDLLDKPVIIGGGKRGVVSTACYLARIKGVRSAMPMGKALRLCPDAVVLRGRMEVYAEVSAAIRQRMEALTPAIEPLSLDEAFLDLRGTEKLHGAPPAILLARLAQEIFDHVGVGISVGLSHNKFLAKIASDLDKPKGFAVIGRAETQSFLRDKPVGIIWGIGAAAQKTLAHVGIRTIDDLLRWEEAELTERFGMMGARLYRLARGEDQRDIRQRSGVKSVSKQVTLQTDTSDFEALSGHLWRLCEQVSDRMKKKQLCGGTVTVTVRRSDFKLRTKRKALPYPSQMAEELFTAAVPLLEDVMTEAPFRLIGVGFANLTAEGAVDQMSDIFEGERQQQNKVEKARDQIRAKFGDKAIIKGRSLR